MNEKARIAADCVVAMETINDGSLSPHEWHVFQAAQWEMLLLAAKLDGPDTHAEDILAELKGQQDV